MKRHLDSLLGLYITLLLALALLATACTELPPQPADTATPFGGEGQPTSPVGTPHPVPELSPSVQPTRPSEIPPVAPEPSPSAPAADVILHNGAILTMEADHPRAEAMAVGGENILAVGNYEEVLALQGPETQLIDLQGRALMPGFVDAHTHILASPDHYGTNLEGVQDLALMYGITTLADMSGTPDLLERMQGLEREGKLRVRSSVYMTYNTNCGDVVGDWYEDYAPTREPGEMLRIGGVKIFADGGVDPATPRR